MTEVSGELSGAVKAADSLGRRLPVWLPAAAIVLAGLAVYCDTLSAPFILDDFQVIVGNPSIRRLWAFGQVLSPPANAGAGGRPLLNLTFALNYALSGERVWSYHALNLIIHILAGLTLFGVVRRTLARWRETPAQRSAVPADLLAFAIALIWTVHPLQTQSVTYVAQRAESLMGLFYLQTMYGFVRFVAGESSSVPRESASAGGSAGRNHWGWLSVISCFLGMATKEVMVTAPVMMLLYDRVFVAGGFREAWRRRWRYYLGLTATWVLLARLMANLPKRGVGFEIGMSWRAYAMTECCAVAKYLWLAIFPHPLVFDYGSFAIHRASELAPCAAVLGLVLTATAIAWCRRPALGFSGIWVFLILAPTSSVVPVAFQPMAESRMYLPLAGVIATIVLGLGAWTGRQGLVALLIVAVGLGFITLRRNKAYGSVLTIWSDTVASRPGNARAQNELGLALLKLGRKSEAIAHLDRALQLKPGDPGAHSNLAVALAKAGDLPGAITQYQDALRLKPDSAEILYNFGNALGAAGRKPEAIARYEEAIRLRPGYAEVEGRLGGLLRGMGRLPEAILHLERAARLKPESAEAHNDLGIALADAGRLQEALAEYRAALSLESDYADAHNNMGSALCKLGQLPQAIAHLERALQIKPDYAEAHDNLGVALGESGLRSQALVQYREALRLKPDLAEAGNNLGNSLIGAERIKDAIAQFEEVLEHNPDYAEAHNGLGVALARDGRLPEAVSQFELVLRLGPERADVHDNLARILRVLGRNDEAQRQFKEAARLRASRAGPIH